jgi:hypothetical protein
MGMGFNVGLEIGAVLEIDAGPTAAALNATANPIKMSFR